MYKQIPDQQVCKLSSLERFFALKKTNKETFINSVVTDLTNLLNSHSLYLEQPTDKLDMNIVHYGLSGFHIYNAYSGADRLKVGDLIKLTILRFEPRLRDITVISMPPDIDMNTMLNFRISGTVLLPQHLMPIVLESKFTANPYKVFLTVNSIG